MKKLLLLFCLLTNASVSLLSQNNLKAEYLNSSSSPDFLNICGDPDLVVVRVKTEGLSGAPRSNISAVLQLFKGVELLSIFAPQTSPGVVLANNSNKNKPVFTLPTLAPNGTSFVNIAFWINADCNYVDSIAANNDALVFDTWTFSYDLGSQIGLAETDATDEYRTAFKVPNLTMSFDQNDPPPARVGDCYSRNLTVANSALEGFVDSVIYTDKLGAGVSLKALFVNGISVPFTKTGTTLDTTIRAFIGSQILLTALKGNGPGNGNPFLDPDERIVIREDICFVNCSKSNLSSHSAGWGCKGAVCNSAVVNGFVRKGDGAPNAVLINNPTAAENVKVGYCKPGKTVVHYQNNGSEIDPGFATMNDVEVQAGIGVGITLETTHLKITSMSVAGVNISPVATTIVLNNNPLFSTDPDGAGGLEDADGDGFFDDLKTGGTFDLEFDYTFNCDSADMVGKDSLCLNEFNYAFNAYIKYTDPCKIRVTKTLPNFGGLQNTNEEALNCIDPDAYPGKSFMIQHIETRGVRTFEKDCGGSERLVAWAKLPPGVTVDLPNCFLFKNNSTTGVPMLSNHINNDTLFLEFDATSAFINGKYDFRVSLVPDCSLPQGRILIPFGVFFSCPSCDCRHGWYCTVLGGPQFHPTAPPCANNVLCPKGLQTTSFDAERTTFGFANAGYTTPMNPALANKHVAIFCDTVKMTVCNVVGGTPISDSLGVVISYDNVEFMKDTNEIFLFKRGLVRFKKGAQNFSCVVDSSDFSVIRDDTTKTLRFKFDRCLADLGLTLQPGDSVKFYGWFLVNPTGPMIDNFRKIPNFRAFGYAIFDSTEYACDDFGKNFSVAKIPTVFATPGSSEFPKGCSNTPFSYRLVTKNVGFSAVYTGGEFYPAVRVDSLVLDYDTTFLDVFENLKVEVSIPGHPKFGNNFFPIQGFSHADKGHFVARFDTLVRVPSYNAVTSYSFNLRVSLTPGCESLSGSALGNNQFQMNPTMYYTDRYFAKNFGDGSCADKRTENRVQKLTYSDPPILSFEPITNPNLLLTNDTAFWQIKQCNISTKADANQTWLAAACDTNQLRIIGFYVLDNPANPIFLPVTSYGNGKFFAFTPGVLRQANNNSASQICNTIAVAAVLKQCGSFPVQLSMGWNCYQNAIQNWTPDDYEPCVFDTLSLTVTALDPMVDATIINQPQNFPSLCDTVSLDVLVRNTGQGPAFDIATNFTIPFSGANLVLGATEIAWPSDSAFQPALGDPTFTGVSPRGQHFQYPNFDLLNNTLKTNGLPGFDPLAPGGANEFKIRYKFTTGCEFVGGQQTFYAFAGKKACGLPTNSESGESFPIQFQGLEAVGTARFEVGFGSGTLLAANGTSTLEIFAKNTTSNASDSQDKIQIKLPQNIVYQPGTSVAVLPNSWVPGDPNIEIVAGISVLSWPLPNGLLLDETASLRFDVATPALNCNADLEAAVSTVRAINYTCPNGSLTCDAEVLTSDGGEKFFDLNVGQTDDFAGADVSTCPNSTVQLDATHAGFSNYSWSPATGLDDPNVPNPTATISQSITYTVTAQDTAGCARVDQLTISVSNSLAASASTQPTSCGLTNGSVSILVSGGSGNYSFNWLPNVSTTSSATGLAAGNYLVTITDAQNNCTIEAFGNVADGGAAISMTLTTIPESTLNPGEGKISVSIFGGAAPFQISWAGQESGSQPNVAFPVYSINHLSAGNYSVTVVDNNGCSNVQSAVVDLSIVNNLTLLVSSLPDTSCCFGRGVIILTAAGGDGNYTFIWSPNQGNLTAIGNGVFQIENVESGLYFITLTDGLGSTKTTTVIVQDACQCGEIFDEEVVYEPGGVEAICIGIPYLYINDYPIFVNNVPYTGPFHPCDFDTVVYYAFSFLPGNGFDGPFKLNSWTCNQMTFHNVVFNDLYDLVDSMNIWDPAGFWFLDDNTSTIIGGDLYDQHFYGQLNIMHLPDWTPYVVKPNYNGFAYGTEIYVNPFDQKVTVTAYDPTTCCSDSVCIIFINPCDDLVPVEPYIAFDDDPTFCVPIPYANLFNYYAFVDGSLVNGLASACSGGAETKLPVPGGQLGLHQLILIDTVQWCADTVDVHVIHRPIISTVNLNTNQGQAITDICLSANELFGDIISLNFCGVPQNGSVGQVIQDSCFTYIPNPTFVGQDIMCAVLCDQYGICDTTMFSITVSSTSPPVPTIRDTFYLTTEINTPIFDICLPTNELLGNVVGIGYCNSPTHGIFFNSGIPCFDYIPNTNYIGVDEVCAYVCDNQGICDTSIFIIMIETPDTNGQMPNRDTIFISTPVNTPYTSLCLPTDELGNAPIATVQICEQAQHGNFLPFGSTCVNFVPQTDFIGLDKACLYLCDTSGLCDTTIIIIMVTPNDSTPDNHDLTLDTIYLQTLANTPIGSTCLDDSELPGNIVGITVLQMPLNGFISSIGNSPCFKYEPDANFTGNEYGIVLLCDNTGLCDTTYVFIEVFPDVTPPTVDTLYFNTNFNTTVNNICVNDDQLTGLPGSVIVCGNPQNGTLSNFTQFCLNYTPNSGFSGTDYFCLVLCDNTGVCDTTIVKITVAPDNPPNVVTKDTIILTTTENTPINSICLDESELNGLAVDVGFCQIPSFGTLGTVGLPCFTYFPNQDFVGKDTACVIICDNTGLCDTTILLITVTDTITPPPTAPDIDTLHFTTHQNIVITNVCIDLSEIPGTPGQIQICNFPENGNLTINTPTCLSYSPNTNFIGGDTACVYVCNNSLPQICDTTILIFTVNPQDTSNNDGSKIDTLYFTTDYETATNTTCLPTTDLPGAIIDFTICGQTNNGNLVFISDSCFAYLPDNQFVGNDTACVILCDNSIPQVCDTTILIFTVNPQDTSNSDGSKIDTLFFTTNFETATPTTCLPTTDLPGTIIDLTICGQTNNGNLVFISDSCFAYLPDNQFVGNDTACVILCDNSIPQVCDTTILIFTVSPQDTSNNDGSKIDTLFFTVKFETATDTICLPTNDLPGAATGGLTFCDPPNHGVLTFNSDSCFVYLPDSQYVGLDTACVILCDNSIPQVCDTTILIFTVSPQDTSNNDGSKIDTLFFTVKFETATDTICLPTNDLPGAATGGLTFCDQPNHGVLTFNSDSCFVYLPDSQYVGMDTACVILCDNSIPQVCDTTILIFTVSPPDTVKVDCGLILNDSVTVEISPSEQFGEVCVENLKLNQVTNYTITDNSLSYSNGYSGCNFDSCFVYTYFTVPDFGQIGPYQLDYWLVDGDSLRLNSFQNIQQLVDSMHVWDAPANWTLDQTTLTIRSCGAIWKNNYGEMRVVQLNTAGVAELEINTNLQPKGTQMKFTPGQHIVIFENNNCADTLWVNIIVSNHQEIDKIIYLDATPDTLCFDDLGIGTANISNIELTCQNANGTHVDFTFDTITHCIIYDGIAIGMDTFCIKITYGLDSCYYLTVRVTVLEPLPCNNFITENSLKVQSPDCQEAEICLAFPFALADEYNILDNGAPASWFVCDTNPQGLSGTGILLSGLGQHLIVFSQKLQPVCADTILVTVECVDTTGDNYVYRDTIEIGQTDSLCMDINANGQVISTVNNCANLGGTFAAFNFENPGDCIEYTGLTATGTDTACMIICYQNNSCDTILMMITVVPQLREPLPPVAVVDFDTLINNDPIRIKVLKNDTLNGQLINLMVLSQPKNGIAIANDTCIQYQPFINYCNSYEPDSLQYLICNAIGCDTAWVYISKPCTEIIIFNGFSPNDDQMNDTFWIEGLSFYPNNHLVIYNRWGNRVYETLGYQNNWAGTWDEKLLPDGVYFYYFDDGEGKLYSGSLTILR